MRILFILEYYYPHVGGVETFFNSLIERLDQEGHDTIVLTNRYDPNLPSRERKGRAIKIIRNRYINRYGFTFFAWWAAVKYARKSDIIHTTSYNAAIPAWIAAKLTNTRSIITFHEKWGKLWYRLPWMTYPSQVLHFVFEWMITKLHFDRFVAVSDYTRDNLLQSGINPAFVTRIYNGINYSGLPVHQKIKSDRPFTFLFFGRVGLAKGLDVLLAAYMLLLQDREDHQLTLVLPSEDSGPLGKIKKMINDSKLGKYITILHDLEYSELLALIATADAVVIPSYSEGFCFAAVESIAIGVPVISSGQGALKEVVSGRHLTSKDHSDKSLAATMGLALDNKWEKLPIIKFHLEETIRHYLKVYGEVAK